MLDSKEPSLCYQYIKGKHDHNILKLNEKHDKELRIKYFIKIYCKSSRTVIQVLKAIYMNK